MKTLIIDSATNILYTALVIDDNIIYESYVPGKKDHASVILVEVEKALEKAKIDLIDINKIIVGIGPGSYTGVRMAVAVGKMISTLEEKIELYEISTLKLISSGYEGTVYASIDARRGNCFGAIYNPITNKYLFDEDLVERSVIEANSYEFTSTEDLFKVNPLRVINYAKKVDEPRTLIPNYLRDTEAERNLK